MLKVDTHYKSHLVPYYIPLIYPSFRINARENFFFKEPRKKIKYDLKNFLLLVRLILLRGQRRNYIKCDFKGFPLIFKTSDEKYLNGRLKNVFLLLKFILYFGKNLTYWARILYQMKHWLWTISTLNQVIIDINMLRITELLLSRNSINWFWGITI